MTSPRMLSSDSQHLSAGVQASPSLGGHDGVLLSLSGGLDITTADMVYEIVARCLRDEPASLTVDLRGLDFCDSTGVRALRWVVRRAGLAGTRCRIVNPQPPVRRLLALADASELITAVDDSRQGPCS